MPSSVLIPLIKVCKTQDCSVAEVYDTTGVYSSRNLNGWGLPNVALSSISSASLTLQTYDAVNDTFSAIIDTIDVLSILPNIANIPYQLTISNADIYYIVVTYTTNANVVYACDFYFVNTCEYWCCYEKKAANSCGCAGGGAELLQIYTLLESIESTTCCGVNLANIVNDLKKLKRLCADCGCGCK